MRDILINKINASDWWHVPPEDPNAYKKRGRFLASTFLQAEFYGRPNDIPDKVTVQNPIFGFSEFEILSKLFNKERAQKYLDSISDDCDDFYQRRIALDARMHDRAKKLGYDSIALMTKSGKRDLLHNRKPNSIELNLII